MEHAIVRHFGIHPFALFGQGMSSGHDFTPPCEVREKDGHYLLSFDLPGMNREDINIEVRGQELHVEGQRKHMHGEGQYTEKRYGHFERAIELPEGVHPEGVKAHYEDGVLNIALKKSEKNPAHTVAISASKKEGFWGQSSGREWPQGLETLDLDYSPFPVAHWGQPGEGGIYASI